MDFFKNGTVMVVVGTVITAALILMATRDGGETAQESMPSEVTQANTSKVSLQQKAEVTVSDEVVSSKEEKSVSKKIKAVAATATIAAVTDVVANGATEEPVEEEKQVTPVDQKVEAAIKETEQNNQVAAPVGLYQKDKGEKAVAETVEKIPSVKQDETTNQTVETKSAIWLDEEMGVFKSVEARDVEFIIMPNSADDLQGSNPKQVVTSKVGKFSPSSIPENYNYQQMPMVNGGYYIAPMPSYLMPSVLPNSAVE